MPTKPDTETIEGVFDTLRQRFPDNCIELSVDAGGWYFLTRTDRDGKLHAIAEGESASEIVALFREALTHTGEQS